MKKIYGAQERQDGLYRIGRNKWEIIFGFGKDSEDETTGYNYRKRFNHLPTLDEIKAVIFKQVNEDTDRAIEYGLTWNGLLVHLDNETQGNIVGMLALLPVAGDSMFPKTFKVGEYENGEPAFYEFTSVKEFAEFAKTASDHKERMYALGWQEKALVTESAFTAQ